MRRNGFLNGVSLKVCAVLPLLVLLSCASAGGGKTKAAEEAEPGISLDEAIEQSVREFKEKTAPPKRVAIVQFDTEAEALSEYIIEEITATLVNFDFEVAERKNLDFVRKELDLQYSGEVDDEAMVSIGRFIGAESVLVGELLKVGSMYRYRLNSINVERAVREAAIRLDVRNDRDFNVILASLRSQKPEDARTAAQPAAPPIARAEAKPEAPAAAKPVPQPETAGAFLDTGILLVGRRFAFHGDFDRAIENFSEAIKLKPDLASAYLLRGRALLASVSNVTSIAEDFSGFGSTVTTGYNNYTAANKSVYDRALTDVNTAIKLDEALPNAYYLRGRLYYDMGDYDRAIADYTKALWIAPNNAATYNSRGLVYFDKKNYDRAIADYTQSLKLFANNAAAYYNRGNAYLAKNDYNRAIADCNHALKIAPANAAVYILRGLVYHNKGDYDRAISDFDQAIRIEPNNAAAYSNRGEAYHGKTDYNSAISDFNQALRIDPDYTNAYVRRGWTYHNRGDYDRAVADYTHAVLLDPDNAVAYNNRGGVHLVKKDYDRAIVDFNQALRIDPNYANSYNNRGVAHYNKGDKSLAREDFRKALELDPNNESARKNLALP
jgi:tetratricopeptide (TPR) repeat protein